MRDPLMFALHCYFMTQAINENLKAEEPLILAKKKSSFTIYSFMKEYFTYKFTENAHSYKVPCNQVEIYNTYKMSVCTEYTL